MGKWCFNSSEVILFDNFMFRWYLGTYSENIRNSDTFDSCKEELVLEKNQNSRDHALCRSVIFSSGGSHCISTCCTWRLRDWKAWCWLEVQFTDQIWSSVRFLFFSSLWDPVYKEQPKFNTFKPAWRSNGDTTVLEYVCWWVDVGQSAIFIP